MKLISAFSCGIFTWSTVELIQNENIQVAIGNSTGIFAKLIFILPYLLLLSIVLKVVSIWDNFNKTQSSIFSSILVIIMVIFDLFYSSFSVIKDSMILTEYENNLISITRKRSLEEKKVFLEHFGENLKVDQKLLLSCKNIDLDDCNSYEDILNKVYSNLAPTPEIVKPSMFSRINEGIFNTVVNHPYIIMSIIAISLIAIYVYKSELKELLKTTNANLLKVIENQVEFANNDRILAENSRILAEAHDYQNQPNGISMKAIEVLKTEMGLLIRMIRDTNIKAAETRDKLNETIVILAKLIRRNPSLDGEEILYYVQHNDLPVDLLT